MSMIFVTLHGGNIKRINNGFDGPGYDHDSNPFGNRIRRRQERHRGKLELAALLREDDIICDDLGDEGVIYDRRANRTRRIRGFIEKPAEGYLALRRGRNGMLRYASYSA